MYRDRDRQLLLMALFVLGASGLAAVRVPALTPVGDAMRGALQPARRLLTTASFAAAGVLVDARDLDGLRDDNARLEQKNAELMAENTKVSDLIRENRALRDELRFARERVDLDLMGASVSGTKIGEEPGNLRRSIALDVGARDGVRAWVPVANHVGLIGQVMSVGAYSCDVMLINDPGSQVQARISRSRHTGIVSGSTSGELVMRYIPQPIGDGEVPVEVGDLVYTSGLSERFPPMLLIGQVVEVRQSDEQTHQEAVIRPAVNFDTVELALVVRGWLPSSDGADRGRGPSEAGAPAAPSAPTP